MLDNKAIALLYEYTRWADARVLGAVSALTPEQFTKDLGSSHRSVRDTLVHIMSAYWIWLSRWKGTSPKAMLPASDYQTFDAVKSKWAAIESEVKAFIEAAGPMDREVAYTNTRGESFRHPLWQIMQHAANHATYHRGQITTMLRQLGATPVATDLVMFYGIQSGQIR